MKIRIFLLLFALLSMFVVPGAFAGSATWNLNPTNNSWLTAGNWTPATVPNGPADIATLNVSNTTGISVLGATVDSIVFNSGASAFTFGVSSGTLTISGAGITNSSGLTQSFVTSSSGDVYFVNSATAGSATLFTNPDLCTTSFFNTASAGNAAFMNSSQTGLTTSGTTHFYNSATAANATITNKRCTTQYAQHGGWTFFHDSSTAADATIINEGSSGASGLTEFYNSSTAANATFTNKHGVGNGGNAGYIGFNDSSTAADAIFLNEGGTAPGESAGGVGFQGPTSAGNAIFTCEGGAANDASGGGVSLGYLADGGNATFILNGGTAPGAYGSNIYLTQNASAGNSTIILNGGANGGRGSLLYVDYDGKGGNARLQVYGNSVADLENPGGVIPNTIGSIEGEGRIRLADTELTVGSNNLSTTFSGLIEDYGYYNETGGSLVKVGQGTLVLTHDNTYTGGTRVKRGILLVNNTTGSGTGPGKVQVEGGILGGNGIINGAVTVGTGGSRPALLAPGTAGLGLLTMQRTLTFGANGAYNWNVDTLIARADTVAANGVTISAGALFTALPRHNATIAIGAVFTVIDNQAATPISGNFSNLADGSTITIGSNTLQANYDGGDGNDLTLTVVAM